MLVVLDTNVFISALLSSKGAPAELIDRWEADEFGVVISPVLVNELERSLTYPRVAKYLKLPQETIPSLLGHLVKVATFVEPQIKLNVIEDDPDDNRVLECALTGGATYIISGDIHLLNLKEYQGIIILSPAGFLTLLKSVEKD
jgi:putative PIN family toxin of toxin-antitoxin system